MASLVLRSAAILLACAALLVRGQLGPAAARTERPLCPDCNVVLVSFDTLRADHVGCYGYDRPTTPNVDRFAERSVVFERAIAQAPWTLPSHGAIFSGLYPARLGVTMYPAMRKLPDTNETLPQFLQRAGYATGGFTGGGFVSAHYGFSRGFDTYTTNGRRFEHNIRQAIGWLDLVRNRRFFLFLHGYDAHRPYYSTRKDKEAVGLDGDLPEERMRYCFREERDRPSDKGLAEIIAYYDAAIRHGDRELGPFFDRLEQLGLMENTIVVVTSDHGEEFFEHGNCDHVRFVYEESVHVPLIVYVPGYSPEGRRIPGLVPASISVARTILDLLGLEHSMPGVSLLPVLRGEREEFPIVYSHAASPAGQFGSRGEVIAATRGDRKLISYLEEGSAEGYDLAADPGEQEILPEDAPPYALRGTLHAWHEAMEPLPRPTSEPPMSREELVERERRRKRRQEAIRRRLAEEEPLDGVEPALDLGKPGQDDDAPKAGRPDAPADRPQGERKPRPDRRPAEEGMEVPDDVRESLKALGYIEE